MKTLARTVVPAGTWNLAIATDRVLIDHDRRFRRRFLLPTESGGEVLLDLPQATRLRQDDGLVLENGDIIRVCARAEALMHITAPDPALLLRLAWHLGNRHLPVQFLPGEMRIRADEVIADMVRSAGGTVANVAAPFDPEGGAYAGGHHHHHDHPDDEADSGHG